MSITQEDVRRILALVESSAFDELKLEMGDFKLAVSKHGPISGGASAPVEAHGAVSSPVPSPAPQASATGSQATSAPAPSSVAPAKDADAGLVEIKSPIVGIFYSAPEPGAPAFVEEGAEVDKDDTVGIVEVMKVFNSVPAGVTGTIVRRLVDNNDFVEFGQALYLVRPKAS